MALFSVLWASALLAAFAISLLFAGNVAHKLAFGSLQSIRNDAITEAAMTRAVLALLDPRSDRRWRIDGVSQPIDIDGVRVQIGIQDELGRIDINHADAPVFEALFQSAGLDQQSADHLIDKILDWRDASPLKRLNGAKQREYQNANRTYAPRNGPFQSIDELKLVLDMTPTLFQRIEPAITVYSGRPGVDPQIAPREALRALTTLNQTSIDTLLAAREASAANSAHGHMGDPINALKGRAYAIRIALATQAGNINREVIIRLTGNPSQPYWVISWRRT